MPPPPVIISHNFVPGDFMWLWAKYVVGFNERYHCTNCLLGRYSSRFSKSRNPRLASEHEIVFDEHTGHRAIYICGVARQGYSTKKNYPLNVHLAIHPALNAQATFTFDRWNVAVRNGVVVQIPGPESLPSRFKAYPSRYTSCRIFRWAANTFALDE